MKIVSGKIPTAKKVVVYGPEGIGKSTFASNFPKPLFIDTEGSTNSMDVSRFEKPQKWEDIIEAVQEVINDPTCCKTLVIDTADWAEMFCIAWVCKKGNVSGIEDFGYGKGYTYVQEEFKKLLDKLEKVISAGINVVFTAHAKMRKFEQPDEMGAYDRWEMKLSKQVAPMLKEWADMVLFANYKTFVVEDDKTKSKKAQGGKRIMYTTHHVCWDAKNRAGLADSMPFDYAGIKNVIENPDFEKIAVPVEVVEETKAKEIKATPEEVKQVEQLFDSSKIDELKKHMEEDGISENLLLYICENKGAVKKHGKIEDINPEFIQKMLLDKWDSFAKYALKVALETPFIV